MGSHRINTIRRYHSRREHVLFSHGYNRSRFGLNSSGKSRSATAMLKCTSGLVVCSNCQHLFQHEICNIYKAAESVRGSSCPIRVSTVRLKDRCHVQRNGGIPRHPGPILWSSMAFPSCPVCLDRNDKGRTINGQISTNRQIRFKWFGDLRRAGYHSSEDWRHFVTKQTGTDGASFYERPQATEEQVLARTLY